MYAEDDEKYKKQVERYKKYYFSVGVSNGL